MGRRIWRRRKRLAVDNRLRYQQCYKLIILCAGEAAATAVGVAAAAEATGVDSAAAVMQAAAVLEEIGNLFRCSLFVVRCKNATLDANCRTTNDEQRSTNYMQHQFAALLMILSRHTGEISRR
jgi:hypothetical protein